METYYLVPNIRIEESLKWDTVHSWESMLLSFRNGSLHKISRPRGKNVSSWYLTSEVPEVPQTILSLFILFGSPSRLYDNILLLKTPHMYDAWYRENRWKWSWKFPYYSLAFIVWANTIMQDAWREKSTRSSAFGFNNLGSNLQKRRACPCDGGTATTEVNICSVIQL